MLWHMQNKLASWIAHLDEEDHQFIKQFLLTSGSLKDLADHYEVTYPTIRLRMDRLIGKLKLLDDEPPADAFDARVRLLVAEGEISTKTGKELLRVHNTVMKGGRK
jgi:hypothetical protein